MAELIPPGSPKFWSRCSNYDSETVEAIVQRVARIREDQKDPRGDRMDIIAVHINYPLDLVKLLDSPQADFMSDINGIEEHLNRNTGELTHGFRPKCSK